MPPGRPSGLDEDDVREQLSKLIARGMNAVEIGEIMGRHRDTIKVWRRDEAVQARVTELRRERVNKFVSKIDADLERRLEDIEDLSVTELLKIRSTVQPKAAETDRPVSPAEAAKRWRDEDERTAQGEPDELTEDENAVSVVTPKGEAIPIPDG